MFKIEYVVALLLLSVGILITFAINELVGVFIQGIAVGMSIMYFMYEKSERVLYKGALSAIFCGR